MIKKKIVELVRTAGPFGRQLIGHLLECGHIVSLTDRAGRESMRHNKLPATRRCMKCERGDPLNEWEDSVATKRLMERMSK